MDQRRIERLYRKAGADRWRVPVPAFAGALEASVASALKGREPAGAAVARYLDSLHVADLALACACNLGDEAAWNEFVRVYRPVLYRAADALDPSGGAREVADALYAELYERRLLTYFHARSTLATWLRAVLSQRFVDRLRSTRHLAPLPDEDALDVAVPSAAPAATAPDRARLLPLLTAALHAALAALPPRDRLRLACYYSQELTLAQTGRVLREHEATVSRQLARSRRAIRDGVERHLRDQARLSDAEIAECFETALADPGALDVHRLLDRKSSPADRSS